MKFKDVKVDDTVYITKEVKYTMLRKKYFKVGLKVTNVTKTQFTLEDGTRANKKYGTIIGGGYTVSLDGTDETEAMEAFKAKVTKARFIHSFLSAADVTALMSDELLDDFEAIIKKHGEELVNKS